MNPARRGRLLKPHEVALLFDVDVKTIGRWAARGRLACIETPGGHRRYRRADVACALGDPHLDLDAELAAIARGDR